MFLIFNIETNFVETIFHLYYLKQLQSILFL